MNKNFKKFIETLFFVLIVGVISFINTFKRHSFIFFLTFLLIFFLSGYTTEVLTFPFREGIGAYYIRNFKIFRGLMFGLLSVFLLFLIVGVAEKLFKVNSNN